MSEPMDTSEGNPIQLTPLPLQQLPQQPLQIQQPPQQPPQQDPTGLIHTAPTNQEPLQQTGTTATTNTLPRDSG